MRKDKRHMIPKELHIKQTPAHQKEMVEAFLEGKAFKIITHSVGGKDKKEQAELGYLSEKGKIEGKAVETRVYKLFCQYRGQQPLFDKIRDRTNAPWTNREMRMIKIALSKEMELSYISRLCGRSVEEIQNKLDRINGKKEHSLF